MTTSPDPKLDELFAAFGGVAKLAAALNLPITTVHSWKRAGRVPAWRLAAIQSVARDMSVEIPPLGDAA
jgi:hypothetical protein